jgi:SAM-dependent methyltransferase
VSEARILELGCGDGGNSIPLAERNPNSTFVGIDRAEELVKKGCSEIAQLGLKNIELIAADIQSYEPQPAAFDYVICHGVYSWVALEVQQRILEIGKKALAPHGVFFVSYNTLPGWRQRGVVRDIMQVGSALSADQSERGRYEAAMRLLATVAGESGSVPAYVREAAQRLTDSEPSYVVQEFLGEHNTALLFSDFMRHAHAHGLQFLSESRVVMMSSEDVSPAMKVLLESLGDDLTMHEQVLDLVRNRTFRETLLCHDSANLNRGLSVKAFKELLFVAQYLPLDDGQSSTACTFKERFSDKELLIPEGECEQVLRLLAQMGPLGATFAEVARHVNSQIAISEHELMRVVVTLWRTGFIDALTTAQCCTQELLAVSKVARAQAQSARKVTSALHESFKLSQLETKVIELLERPQELGSIFEGLTSEASRVEIADAVKLLREKGFFL